MKRRVSRLVALIIAALIVTAPHATIWHTPNQVFWLDEDSSGQYWLTVNGTPLRVGLPPAEYIGTWKGLAGATPGVAGQLTEYWTSAHVCYVEPELTWEYVDRHHQFWPTNVLCDGVSRSVDGTAMVDSDSWRLLLVQTSEGNLKLVSPNNFTDVMRFGSGVVYASLMMGSPNIPIGSQLENGFYKKQSPGAMSNEIAFYTALPHTNE